MHFDKGLLQCYHELLQNTELQKAYQEWLTLFRFLRRELEQQMPEYTFQANVTENGMDYSYFQFYDVCLKRLGLKMVVVFRHREFRLEIWLSGVNRKAQCEWAEKLACQVLPFERSPDPKHTDYILRFPISAKLSDGTQTVCAIKEAAENLLVALEKKRSTL